MQASTCAGSLHPTVAAKPVPNASASASVGCLADAYPLWMIARWKYGALPGDTIWKLTLCPPADCPAIVTLSGSPPNAAMLSRTQAMAAR